MLRRILKRAKLWYPLTDDIKPLKEPRTIGRALTPSQKSALLEAVALKPEWETNLRYETVMVHDELNVFTYDC